MLVAHRKKGNLYHVYRARVSKKVFFQSCSFPNSFDTPKQVEVLTHQLAGIFRKVIRTIHPVSENVTELYCTKCSIHQILAPPIKLQQSCQQHSLLCSILAYDAVSICHCAVVTTLVTPAANNYAQLFSTTMLSRIPSIGKIRLKSHPM